MIHIGEHLKTCRVLTTLATVALAADAVHCHGQHLMGLSRESTEAHPTGAEAGADAFHALHLIQRQRSRRHLELQQIAKRHHRTVLQQRLVSGEMVVAGALGQSLVERLGQFRVVAVILRSVAVLNKTHELELAAIQLGERLGMHRQSFVRQFGKGHASHTAGRAAEGGVDHIGTEADRLEDLCAVVAGQQRNADLGEDFSEAVFKRDAHIGLNLISTEVWKFSLLDPFSCFGVLEPVARGLPGQPRTDRAGAVADQTGHVMRAPALRGVNHQ